MNNFKQNTLEQHLNSKIDSLKEGRKEVSNIHFAMMLISMAVIVICLATQNAMYGYGQGANYGAMVLLAVMYFSGDVALATISSLAGKKRSIFLQLALAKIGLILLSVTAGVSFMLTQQHSNDLSASRISEIEAQILTERKAISEMPRNYITMRNEANRRIGILEKDLKAERMRVGGEHASSNALYLYLSQLTGYSFMLVSFVVRTVWIVVFIFVGMVLSTLLAVLWCPWKEDAAYRMLLRKEKKEIKRIKRRIKLENERRKLFKQDIPVENINDEKEVVKKEVEVKRPVISQRAPTRDTNTSGETSQRYREVVEKVASGELSPSVRSLLKLGMGSMTARRYLSSMEKDRLIIRKGRGYVPINV